MNSTCKCNNQLVVVLHKTKSCNEWELNNTTVRLLLSWTLIKTEWVHHTVRQVEAFILSPRTHSSNSSLHTLWRLRQFSLASLTHYLSELFADLGRTVSHRCSVGELPLLVVSGIHRTWGDESGRTRRTSGSRQRKLEKKMRRRGRSEGWVGDYCQVMR